MNAATLDSRLMDILDQYFREVIDDVPAGVMTGCMVIGLYALPDDEAMLVRKPVGVGMNFYARIGALEECLTFYRSQLDRDAQLGDADSDV